MTKRVFLKNKKTNNVFEVTENLYGNFELISTNFSDYKEIFCGRPSIYGNPFSHLNCSTAKYFVSSREEAIQSYKEKCIPFLKKEIDLLKQYTNICLTCFCVPKLCHTFEIAKELLK